MWECQKCHEKIEPSFDVCWNCGTSKEGVEDPAFDQAKDSIEGPSLEQAREAAEEFAETVITSHEPRPSQSPKARRPTGEACPRCGSNRLIPGVRIIDRDGEYADKSLSVRLDRHPEALVFKGTEVVELRANICGDCGHAEVYATNPAALWSAYQEQQGKK